MAGEVINIDPGTTTPIMVDSIGGTAYAQQMKINLGADGVDGAIWDGKAQGGTINAGTVTVTSGSIAVTAGTTVVTSGSISVIAGTGIVSSGSISVIAGTGIVTSGSIVVTTGTIAAGTLNNLVSGTINSATAVLNSGTINVATAVITTLPNLPQGSINVTAGTMIMTNGTVGAGTIVVSAGTIAAGSITITGGTVTAGSIIVTAGTVTSLGTAVGIGTLSSVGQIHNAGTLQGGTVKDDGRTGRNILSYGTTFAGTAAAYGTLIGSTPVGAGTSTWIQDFSIVNPYGTVSCLLGLGTALSGSSVLFKGVLGTQTVGGIEKSFGKAVNCGMTNQDLVIYVAAAGTVDVSVSYFISA